MNKENIQKVIDMISKDNGTHFRMKNWVCYVNSPEDRMTSDARGTLTRYVHCGTAFCVSGYANLLRLEEMNANPKATEGKDFFTQFSDWEASASWLGLETYNQAAELFMYGWEYSDERESFDDLPAPVRRQAAINVLSTLRDTGAIDWGVAIDDAKKNVDEKTQ